MIWDLTFEDIKEIVEIADKLIVENENTKELLEKYHSEEEYYTKVLEEYKQTKQYMGHFSVQSTSFDSGFKPDFIIEVPDLDKVQEEAIKYADKTYPPKFHEIDGNDFDDSETTKRSVAEQGFYDGGKFILDIFNFGTKVVLDKYENN